MKIRKRVRLILEPAATGDRLSRSFDTFIVSLIFLNVVGLILETVRGLGSDWLLALRWFEVVSVLIFTAEYLARLWSCTIEAPYRHPVWGRLRFAATPMLVIDLLAIAPFYLPMVMVDLRFLRAVRLLRVFRLLKIARYSNALTLMVRVVRSRREELVITAAVTLLLIVIASCLMYYAEHEAQPEIFSSIPAAMWWAVVTLTTVGYGDVFPVTTAGKLVGAVIAFLGIGLFALPTGILGAGFVSEIQSRRQPKRCPHCNGLLDTP